MYKIILLPLIAGSISQLCKIFIRKNKLSFKIKNFAAYSGMPSTHSAIVSSLALTTGLNDGFHSSVFAISLIFALVVIRDALGIRQYLGEHGRVINILLNDLSDDNVLEKKYPHLLERIGHTPLQVFVGFSIGVIVSLFGYFCI